MPSRLFEQETVLELDMLFFGEHQSRSTYSKRKGVMLNLDGCQGTLGSAGTRRQTKQSGGLLAGMLH
jgi:hypothetical protein